MIDLQKHHLDRIDAMATARNVDPAEILTECLVEVGPTPTAGQITSWLFAAMQDMGLEPRSYFQEKPEAVAAWASIEAGEEDAPALTVEQFKAIVECGKARGSRVRLDFGGGK
jgi:hypothetical protein